MFKISSEQNGTLTVGCQTKINNSQCTAVADPVNPLGGAIYIYIYIYTPDPLPPLDPPQYS